MRKGRWSKRGMEKSLYLLEIHAVLFIDEVGLGFPKRFGIFREKKKKEEGVSVVAHRVMNPTSIQEDAGSIPGLVEWVKDPVLS